MVTEPPLVIPFLPSVSVKGPLPVDPVRVAAWTISTPAGPSRRLALAAKDNSVWICTSRMAAPKHLAPPELELPSTSYASTAQGSRHSSARSVSGGIPTPGIVTRPRATSTASSILTSRSSLSRNRGFSPTSSTSNILLPTSISQATASAAPTDTCTHRKSFSENKPDLRETLRGQVDVDDRSSLGLGIAGLTRRGIPTVFPGSELPDSMPEGAEGTDTPQSTETMTPVPTGSGASASSDSTKSTARAHRISGFWGRGDEREDKEAAHRAAKNEQEVELEMAKEEAEDQREEEDLRTVERAARTPMGHNAQSPMGELPPDSGIPPVRIVLPDSGRGQIIDLAVLEEIGELVILRDVGLLDVISLTNLQLLKHMSLDHVVVESATTGRIPLLTSPWLWRRVHLAAREEGALLIANAEPWPSPWPTPNGDVTRVVMLSLPNHTCVASLDLPGIGDVGVATNGEASFLLHASNTSLMSYPIIFPAHSEPPTRAATPKGSNPNSATGSPRLHPTHSGRRTGSLAPVRAASSSKLETGLAKFLAARRTSSRKVDQAEKPVAVGVEEGTEVERDGGGHWLSIRLHDHGEGLGLGEGDVEAFEFDGSKLNVRGSIPATGTVRDVVFSSGWQDVVVVTDSDAIVLTREAKATSHESSLKWKQRKTLAAHAAYISMGVVYAASSTQVTNIDIGSLETRIEHRLTPPEAGEHLCPLGADNVFVADGNGNMRKQSLVDYLHGIPGDEDVMASDRLDAPVTCSAVVLVDHAIGGRLLVAGDADGELRIWDAQSMRLRGSWTLFDDPVRSATPLDMDEAGSLRGMLLCTSMKGAVAVISLAEMEELFLCPAARGPLTRIFVGGKDIMLAYETTKVRVWNVETREFRRSTGLDAADDMLQSQGWAEVNFIAAPELVSPVTKVVGPTPVGSDIGRLLQLDLRQLGRWLNVEAGDGAVAALKGLLSVFLTFGVNSAIDEVCVSNLGITPPSQPAAVGLEGPHGSATVAYMQPSAVWRVSPAATGLRQLAIVTLLRPFLDSPEHETYAADVIAFYTACLPDDAVEAELELFAAFYLDSAPDVHQAARILFGARISRMSNEEIEALVALHQSELPSVVPADQRLSECAARALTMMGGMALHRFSCMNPSALKAVAESLAMYLHEPGSPHIALAIELVSKGFTTWQAYVDPMEMLRRLFFLATQHKESGANVAAQARLAVLHVASSNAPLFMSTLSMDILDAKSVQGRTAIMKLCVFMARKRPALLENGLPRIAEAVVKSLDPNVGKMRDDVWEAATVILNELVLAFKTIGFHSGTQKLAVGTHEGAVIMYDLKTASRLYVLEPHRGAVAAVSFAPDGRRLVTVSLEDGDATVWKIGASISGFFNVGGPPRQGAARGEPYKRVPFVVAEVDPEGTTGALSSVRTEWPGNRTARVQIGETQLTFETT